MSNKPKIYDITATGSTEPRDIRDRFSDVINVKDFGAVGDGVTYDTAVNSNIPSAPKANDMMLKNGQIYMLKNGAVYTLNMTVTS